MKPCRYGTDRWEAAIYETPKDRILALHYCPCHDFWPYTPEALRKAMREGKFAKIICCFPAHAKRRHPDLAPFIVGNWEGVTMCSSGCGTCDRCQLSFELIVQEDLAETIRHYAEIERGIDHMGGKVPRYREPLKKAA